MARFDTSFNFGANKAKKSGKGKKSSSKKASSSSNAWTAYVGKK